MSGVITQLATRVTSLARRTRASWIAGSATALLIVAIASLLRWLLTPLGLYSAPFITYFPAVLLATLFGGVWGGIVATLTSAGMAWFVLLPPSMGLPINEPEALALALFVAINVLDIALVTMLIRAYDLVAEQARSIRELLDRQTFLMRELNHRSRNLFTVVQSLALHSIPDKHSREVFEGRLIALARAHGKLGDSEIQLGEIIRGELKPFAESVEISGCELSVNTRAAQQLALVVHELATNAAKYGALAAPAGRVFVGGRVEHLNGEPTFGLMWTEQGGPPVHAPNRKGFGSAILLDLVRSEGGEGSLEFLPEGLRYKLRLPLREVEGD
jgi:two-component sensor histidine kinase